MQPARFGGPGFANPWERAREGFDEMPIGCQIPLDVISTEARKNISKSYNKLSAAEIDTLHCARKRSLSGPLLLVLPMLLSHGGVHVDALW
eukprot:4454653-Pyramimonas_sp.AAC.1